RVTPAALRLRDHGFGGTMSHLPLFPHSPPSQEPFSRQTVRKTSRLRGATVTEGLCPYCAVGCGQLIYTKGGQLIDIEGNPESPINEGTLCPKGANSFQLAVNPHRVTQVLYRAPYSDHWETRSRAGSRQRATPTSQSGTRRVVCSTRSAPSARWAVPRSTTRRTTSSRSFSAEGLESFPSRTRPGYDTAPRCPVWAPRSAAAQRPRTSRTW